MYQRGEMNKNRWLWLGFILLVALLLGGCAQPEVIEETVEPPVVEAPVTEEEAYPVEEVVVEPETAYPVEEQPIEEEQPPDEEVAVHDEDARMEALISEKIGGCHMLNFILQQSKTREEWSVTIDRMIGKGAQINEEEKELIIDWLVSREQ
jgi:PBP1b-binding outer membrane lipoprotein LpoB